MGIAIIGSIATAVYRGQMADDAMVGVPGEAVDIARNTLGGAVAAASSLPDETSSLLLTSAHAAFTRALEMTSLVSAAVTLALAVLAAVALRNVRR
jgi:DHA2 family multidrug resistance protein-like MFS transporter